MDEGAEALLARRPEGIELIAAAGLGDDLVPAGVTSSAIYTRGAMRPLPRRQFMGVPADLDELAATGVISAGGRRAGQGRGRRGRPRAATSSVTEYIGSQARRRDRRPAGRPAARRRVRGPVRGPVVHRHPRAARRRGARPRHADRGGRLAAPAPPSPAQPSPAAGVRRQAGPGLRHADHRARRAARGGGQGVRRRRSAPARWSASSRAPRRAGGSPSAPPPTPSTWTPTR